MNRHYSIPIINAYKLEAEILCVPSAHLNSTMITEMAEALINFIYEWSAEGYFDAIETYIKELRYTEQ